MPNIREYVNPLNGLQPTDSGAVAQAIAGRSIGSNISEVGRSIGGGISAAGSAFVAHQTREEISTGLTDLTRLQGGLDETWRQTTTHSSHDDTTIGDTFRQSVLEPQLDAWVEGATTVESRTWRQERAAALRQHYQERVAADMATRAGTSFLINLDASTNLAANNVFHDPTAMDANIGSLRAGFDAMVAHTPNLSQEQAERARLALDTQTIPQVVRAGVVGTIEHDPAAGRALLASGRYDQYLDASQRTQLENYADQVEEHNQAQARIDQAQLRITQREEANTAERQITSSFTMNPTTGLWSAPANYFAMRRAYAAMPGADASFIAASDARVRTYTEDAARPVPVQTDPHVFEDFRRRMAIPPGQPGALTTTEVFQAEANRQLSQTDGNMFEQSTSRAATEERPEQRDGRASLNHFLDGMKSSLTTSNPFSMHSDAIGDQRYYQFQVTASNMFETYAQEHGYAQAQRDLLDPRSAQYLGRMVPQFAMSRDQVHTIEQGNRGGGGVVVPFPGALSASPSHPLPVASNVPHINPGETPEHFLARVGTSAGPPRAAPAPRGQVPAVAPPGPVTRPQAPPDPRARAAAPRTRVGHDREGAPTVTVGIEPMQPPGLRVQVTPPPRSRRR